MLCTFPGKSIPVFHIWVTYRRYRELLWVDNLEQMLCSLTHHPNSVYSLIRFITWLCHLCCYHIHKPVIILVYCADIVPYQILLLACNCSRRVLWPNTPQPWGIYKWYSPVFKTVSVAKNIWRIINTIVSFRRKKCSEICPWSLSVPQSSKFLKFYSWKLFASWNR